MLRIAMAAAAREAQPQRHADDRRPDHAHATNVRPPWDLPVV